MSLPVVNKPNANPFDCGLGYAGFCGIFIAKSCDKKNDQDAYKILNVINALSFVPGLGVVTGGLKIWFKEKNMNDDPAKLSDHDKNVQRKLRIGLVVVAIFEILGLGLLTLPVHIYASVIRYQRYTQSEKEMSHPKANNQLPRKVGVA